MYDPDLPSSAAGIGTGTPSGLMSAVFRNTGKRADDTRSFIMSLAHSLSVEKMCRCPSSVCITTDTFVPVMSEISAACRRKQQPSSLADAQ